MNAVFGLLALSLAAPACSNRCPGGTTPAGLAAPAGTAQWCEAEQRPTQSPGMPAGEAPAGEAAAGETATGETATGEAPAVETAAVQAPVVETPEVEPAANREEWPGTPPEAAGRALQGPMTTWTEDGQLESHGEFAMDASGLSKAEGLWTFWHSNGHVHSRGHYAMGVPVGCVSRWDADGTQHTGRWNSEQLVYEDLPCAGPTTKGLAELESSLDDERTDTVEFDLSVSTLVVGGGFGIHNDSFEVGSPSVAANVEVAVRRHLGAFRMGALHDGWIAAATLAYPLPSFHEKLDLEASLALGIQNTNSELVLRGDPEYKAISSPTFFGLYTAAELQAVLPIHDNVAFVLSTRAEGGIPSEREQTSYFQRGNEPPLPYEETWRVGRYSLGIGLGVRALLH